MIKDLKSQEYIIKQEYEAQIADTTDYIAKK